MPPEGGGRGSHYTQAHLDRIRELQQLSDQGVPLSKIKEYFEKGTPDIEEHTVILNDSMMARPLDIGSETWNRHEIIDGVELHIRADAMTEEGKRKFLNEVRKLL
jgi:DNA-binding transcriptional MerR regulator